MKREYMCLRSDEGLPDWPNELLHISDDRHCRLKGAYDAYVARSNQMSHEHSLWAPRRASGGHDAGIVAHGPRAGTAGCWPETIPRTLFRPAKQAGFHVAVCPPTNANEIRRDRPNDVGALGGTCSRSHQTFMNTTRKCTGTFDPRARQTCKSHDHQNLAIS